MIIVTKALKVYFVNALNICALLKLKKLRFNNSAFMTKKLRKKLQKVQN